MLLKKTALVFGLFSLFQVGTPAFAQPAKVVSELAENYPSRTVRIVVAFAPGGGADILGRILSKTLSERLGQSFVIENKPGAAGNIAAEHVARSNPDGHTLLITTASIAVNESLYKNLGYKLGKDLVGVTQLASVPLALFVNESVPANSVAELISLARKSKTGLDSASNGSGTTSHLASVMFAQRANVPMVNIPYKGSAPSVTALMSGETHMGFTSIISASSAMEAGKVKALAVTTLQPSPQLPGVPTMASVLPDFEIDQWYGMFAPGGTPPAILEKIHREVSNALKASDVVEYLKREGARAVANTPKEFASVLDSETRKYAKLVAATGLQVE